MILTAYEFDYNNDSFITLIKEFKLSTVAPILGNKFTMFAKIINPKT